MAKVIGILGLGLIGGSLGLDLVRLGYTVVGVSQRIQTCAIACERGAVTVAGTHWALLKAADIVFNCLPMDKVHGSMERLVTLLRPGTVVTDVASVKMPFIESATAIWPWFVGGHPMAGTAHQGITAALPHLFRERPYVLTPIPATNPDSLAQVQHLITALEAQLYTTDPASHDQAVALISHAPVFISAALLLTTQSAPPGIQHLAQQLASSGFADTTRVGGGNPELGLNMALYNRAALLEQLGSYQYVIEKLRENIAQGDGQALETLLKQSQQLRQDYVT
jgi:arogenate dehydrogenase (NADP+)